MPRLSGIRTKAGIWRMIACGCCNGVEWGGEYPRECRDCGGGGTLWVSPNGRLAQYPGGLFRGIASGSEIRRSRPLRHLVDGR